jgi:hypothetical protein
LFRITITAVIFSSFLFSLEGQQPPSTDKSPVPNKPAAQRSAAIESLINDARSLPAEFAIDILLRLTASNNVDKKWKREILAEAFSLSANTQNEFRMKSKYGTPVDSRVNYRSYAFALNLDALSLRSKIISQSVTIDKAQALRLLNQMPPKLRLAPLSCTDQSVYHVDDFYVMLGSVAKAVYDERRIQQGERVQFLLPYVHSMSSPAQIAPAARMILSLHLTDKELVIISQTFASALKEISADDRSFTAAMTQDRTATHVFELIQQVRRAGGAYGELANALRSYLSKHLNGIRCEDNVTPIAAELPRHIQEINYYFRDNPFTPDDLKPAKVEETPSSSEYFESKNASKLSTDLKELSSYENDEAATKEKTISASQEQILDYLRQLNDWNGQGETSEIDYFHEKCVLYLALARIVPAGELGEQVITSYINFLNQPAILQESRIEWMLHARELLGLLQQRKGEERATLVNALTYSKNPILQTYARLMNANIR